MTKFHSIYTYIYICIYIYIYMYIHIYIYIHIISGFLKFPHFSFEKKTPVPRSTRRRRRPRQGDFAADGLALGGAAGAASLRLGGAQGAAPRAVHDRAAGGMAFGGVKRWGKPSKNHGKCDEMWKKCWFSWWFWLNGEIMGICKVHVLQPMI